MASNIHKDKIGKEPPVALSRSERRKHGKTLRDKCPRTAQAEWKPRAKSIDIVKLLEESDADRIPALIPVKYQRMAESAFKFYRGTAIIQARDLANARVSGIKVQACGDCHLSNFGGFATPERVLVFDINDFDETFPGPWEWDMKRLGASLVLAARDRNFSKTTGDEVVRAAAAAYRVRMAEYAEMKVLDTWYAQIRIDDVVEYFRKDADMFARLSRKIKKAYASTSDAAIPKLTAVVDGRRLIKDNPPFIFHFQQNMENLAETSRSHFEEYKKSLPAERLRLIDRYRLEDTAVKAVGVGSVGTRCFVSLLQAEEDDLLLVQIKEARRSVLESPRGKSLYPNQGYRIVTGQRLMQAASDIFLGWFRSVHGRDYYVRQFRDMKVSAEVETFRSGTLVGYAHLCGGTLARAHAKAGDAATISGYLGNSAQFDDALVRYSKAYADQAEVDFAAFQAALRSGRLSTEPPKGGGLEFLT